MIHAVREMVQNRDSQVETVHPATVPTPYPLRVTTQPNNPFNAAPYPGATPQGMPPFNAVGNLRVNIQGSIMTSNVITPTLLVDGRQMPSEYGSNDHLVAAGRHHIELYAQWMRRYGQASIDVDVRPGENVEVFYAAPLHQFTTGNIGLVKQKRKGLALLIVMLAVILSIFVVPLILMLAMGS